MRVLEAVERGDERWELRRDSAGREYGVRVGHGRVSVRWYEEARDTKSLEGDVPTVVEILE